MYQARHPSSSAATPLLLLLLWVVVGSIVPFVPVASVAAAFGRLHDGMTMLAIEPPAAFTIVERVVGFVPLGLLLSWRLEQRTRLGRGIATVAMIVVIAAAVEAIQAPLTTRHPRLSDFLIAAAAGAFGVLLGRRMDAARVFGAINASWRRRAALALLIAGQLAIVAILTAAHLAARISGWDRTYPLLIANERTGDRPWVGCIRNLAIYATDMPAAELDKLAATPMTPANASMRTQMRPLALYDFTRVVAGRISNDGAAGPDLDLSIGPPTGYADAHDGLCIRSSSIIRAEAPAAAICRAAENAQAITVEAELISNDPTQNGPARIVSISTDPLLRNFTLGQEGGDLDLRVRTPRGGRNGMRVPIRTNDRPLAAGWHHVVASYARGAARLWVDGRPARRPVRLYAISTFLFGRDSPISTALLVGCLFLTMGLLFARYVPAVQQRLAAVLWGIPIVVAAPLLVAAGLSIALNHAPDPALIAAMGIASLAGLLIGARAV